MIPKIPFAFVVGCPRSGTTLLQRMLNNHPDLAVCNDTHFIPAGLNRKKPGGDPCLTSEMVDRVRNYRRIHRLGLAASAFDRAAENANTSGEFVTALYAEVARIQGKPLAGEKTPDYARYLPLLEDLFPWAKFVHIIRDGRNVALSILEWATKRGSGPAKFELWRDQPIAVCALWWRWLVTTGRTDGDKLGPARYREIVYENLVALPEPEIIGLTDFLELPYSSSMLDYHVGRIRSEPGLSAKKAWLPPTKGLRDWRTEMEEQDVELFEAIGGDLLAELGYERSTYHFSSKIKSLTRDCIGWWEQKKGPLVAVRP